MILTRSFHLNVKENQPATKRSHLVEKQKDFSDQKRIDSQPENSLSGDGSQLVSNEALDRTSCSPVNLSLSQQENTQTLGAARFKPSARFIQVIKTKRYMAYHRNVIYNPSNIQLQKTRSQAKKIEMGLWNNSWVKNLPVRPLAPRRKTPGQLYPIKNGPPGKTN